MWADSTPAMPKCLSKILCFVIILCNMQNGNSFNKLHDFWFMHMLLICERISCLCRQSFESFDDNKSTSCSKPICLVGATKSSSLSKRRLNSETSGVWLVLSDHCYYYYYLNYFVLCNVYPSSLGCSDAKTSERIKLDGVEKQTPSQLKGTNSSNVFGTWVSNQANDSTTQ